MFKIGSGRNTWIAVRWNGLAEDGATIENEVDLNVLLVDRDRLQEQVRAEGEGGSTDGFALEVTKGWRKVGDIDGNALPFTPDNFKLLFASPGFAVAFGAAYGQAWHGQSGIREKNSATSPDAGQPAGEPSPKPAA